MFAGSRMVHARESILIPSGDDYPFIKTSFDDDVPVGGIHLIFNQGRYSSGAERRVIRSLSERAGELTLMGIERERQHMFPEVRYLNVMDVCLQYLRPQNFPKLVGVRLFLNKYSLLTKIDDFFSERVVAIERRHIFRAVDGTDENFANVTAETWAKFGAVRKMRDDEHWREVLETPHIFPQLEALGTATVRSLEDVEPILLRAGSTRGIREMSVVAGLRRMSELEDIHRRSKCLKWSQKRHRIDVLNLAVEVEDPTWRFGCYRIRETTRDALMQFGEWLADQVILEVNAPIWKEGGIRWHFGIRPRGAEHKTLAYKDVFPKDLETLGPVFLLDE